MNKYEAAKVQVKAREIADKVLEMDDKQYKKFVGKLQGEINVLNAGIETTEDKLHQLQNKKIAKMAEGDGVIVTGLGGVAGFVGAIIACANQLAPMEFVDVLIMGSSALGATGVGVIGGALVSAMCEENPVGKGFNKLQQHIQKKKLARLNNQLEEKDTIMDEICEAVIARDMGM